MLHRRTLLACSLALPFGFAQAASAVGELAPDFALRDANGHDVKLSYFRGKYVVLEWISPGCPFVRKHYESGNMPATQREAVARGVAWLTMYSDDDTSPHYTKPARLQAWMRERKAAATAVLVDGNGAVGRAYHARTTLDMYIVSPTGILLYAGAIDSIPSADRADIPKATNYVRQGLTEALAGRPVSVPVTRPYGCTIQYKA